MGRASRSLLAIPLAFAVSTSLGADKVLPYQDAFPERPKPGAASSFLSLYDAYYGGYWFRPSRRNVFYYVVFADRRGTLDALADPENLGTRAGSDGFADELAFRFPMPGRSRRVGRERRSR
ncbi:MAG: hypothetical protein ACUVYA_13175 [Planctomycetota bacterium]